MSRPDDRAVQAALEAAGDAAGALLWRQLCGALGGELRVGLCAREAGSGRRLAARLPEVPGGSWAAVPLDGEDEGGGVGLGGLDRLFSVHALLFATPMGAALGATERAALAALDRAGAPAVRAVTVADAHLLERLSDDPDREREAVIARVRELLPEGWAYVDDIELPGWLAGLAASRPQLVERRKREVARALLAEQVARLEGAVRVAESRREQVSALVRAEDDALTEIRRQARRTAGHTLAIVRRHTEQLDLDLQGHLRALEAELPEQLLAVDPETARQVLPHWLTHVVESWMSDRLAAWRRDVLRELEELEIDEVVRAELLVPALQPSPVRGESRWGRRLASTAAFGGAAALLAFGLWIPGLAALAGGVVWSAFRRGEGDAADRERLAATGRAALRAMGDEAGRLLRAQLDQLAAELDALTHGAAAESGRARAEARASLAARLADQERALAEARGAQDALRATLGAMEVA